MLWADAAGFLVVLATLALNRPPFPAPSEPESASEPAERLDAVPARDGVVARLLHHSVIGTLVLPYFFVVFATSLEAVASVFFLRGLAHDDVAFGVALAAWALGMIPGARIGARLADTADNRRKHVRLVPIRPLMLGAGTVMGAALLGEVLSPSIWAVAGLFLLGGAANGVVNVAVRAAVYEHVPFRFHGRTWAYVRVLSNTAAVVGMVLGTPNRFYGAVPVIAASGILCLVGCGLVGGLLALRRPASVEPAQKGAFPRSGE